jgi:hypothetical protein
MNFIKKYVFGINLWYYYFVYNNIINKEVYY